MSDNNFQIMKKTSYIANTFLALCVVGMLFVYMHFKVQLMVYISIPVLMLYALFFALISINRVDLYFWFVYTTIGIYMCVATVCLGINYGFNLYCMSLIPIGFFCEYLAHKIKARYTKTGYASIGLVIVYFVSLGISLRNGPLYNVGGKSEVVFYLMNSLFVFIFLIYYSKLIINVVLDSEKKLERMALYDNLTGLFNRHCLMDKLREMESRQMINWVALVDIDKFKQVNDNYGHNAGDEVLKTVSKIMLDVCPDCDIGRWGGEEFIIVPCLPEIKEEMLEQLRARVEATEIVYEDTKIKVTLSAGASYYSETKNLEKCIQKSDECLYVSKNSGRNRITWSR